MKIQMNIPNKKFSFDCEKIPRIGEYIVHNKKAYFIKTIFHYVEPINKIEIDAEFRFKL